MRDPRDSEEIDFDLQRLVRLLQNGPQTAEQASVALDIPYAVMRGYMQRLACRKSIAAEVHPMQPTIYHSLSSGFVAVQRDWLQTAFFGDGVAPSIREQNEARHT